MDNEVELRFRKPEPFDVEALYKQKNNALVTATLGGFSTGYARRDIEQWVERMRTATSDAVFVVADSADSCLGHVGLYNIDHRARAAELGIMIGVQSAWGKGLGTRCIRWMVAFGFNEMALHRIHLSVLEHNPRAVSLYERCGFMVEGRHRHVQWRDGHWLDAISMSVLESDWPGNDS